MKLEIKQNKLMEHLNYVIRGISNKNLNEVKKQVTLVN